MNNSFDFVSKDIAVDIAVVLAIKVSNVRTVKTPQLRSLLYTLRVLL